MTLLTRIREKIVEAVPEIEWTECPWCEERNWRPDTIGYCRNGHFLGELDVKTRSITLADVLRAMQGKTGTTEVIGASINGQFLDCSPDGQYLRVYDEPIWNLSLSYDDQEEDVKLFVGKVLGIEMAGCGTCVGTCIGHQSSQNV